MRVTLPFLLALVGLGACAGEPRPAAFPSVAALEDEPVARAAQLESAGARKEPGKTAREKTLYKVETVAATAAAIIGTIFSTSPNAVVGIAAPIDETLVFEKPPATAEERKAASISFPSISTGAYGYPIEEAAPIALREISAHLESGTGSVREALVVLFSKSDYETYGRALAGLAGEQLE